MLRFARRKLSRPGEFADNPPVLVNSLPKSGTHLLLQMVLGIGAYTSYGGFIATTPSLTMRRRSDRAALRMIRGLCPGEICGAHLHHSEDLAESMRGRKIVQLFIYRDPRDVFWSEMKYLLEMNPWHRAGRFARKIEDADRRFEFFLYGKNAGVPWDFEWPAFAERVKPYIGWITDEGVFSCRYEDLRDPEVREATVTSLAGYLRAHAPILERFSVSELAARMVGAINPSISHTFRKGGHGEWRDGLSMDQRQALEDEVRQVPGVFGERRDGS